MNYSTYLYFLPLAIFYVILSVMAWSECRDETEDNESVFDTEDDNFRFDYLWWSVNIVIAIILALIGLIKLLNP